MWSESLEFLRNSMEKRETSGNIGVDDIDNYYRKSATSSLTSCCTDSPISDFLPDSLIEDPVFDVPSPPSPVEDHQPPPFVAQRAIATKKQRGQSRRGSKHLSTFQSSLLNQMERVWNDQDNPDRMYLLSLLPTNFEQPMLHCHTLGPILRTQNLRLFLGSNKPSAS